MNVTTGKEGKARGRKHVGGLQEDEQVARLVAEVNFFSLLSHLYWGIWALVQARYSPIDFDYLGYYHLRMGEFRRRKSEILHSLEKSHPWVGSGGVGIPNAVDADPASSLASV